MSEELRRNQSETFPDERSFQVVCESITRKYAKLLESIPDAIIIIDTSGKIVLANPQTEAQFGYASSELVSRDIEILVPTRLRKSHVAQRNTYFERPQLRPMGQGQELLGVRSDGSEFPVEISLSPMETDVGLLVSAAIRDVSLRVNIERALRSSEERVRLLLDSTAEAIYGLDLQGNCTFCNPACLTMLGYHHTEDLLGKNMHEVIHHKRPDGTPYPMHECKIYEAFRLGEGTHVDDEVLWKADGTSFPAEYRSVPVRRDGELVGSVVTFLDITEQKHIEEALRAQQSELTHVARLNTLGEMAAGLAHELNQPLTAISAFAEGASVRFERGTLRETEITSVFSRIAEDAHRAGNIIKRLRNLVQKRGVQRHTVDVNELVRDVHRLVESDTKQNDISIELHLGNDLPAVFADPIEIQQVLLNLIRNSCDAVSQSDSAEQSIVVSSYEMKPGRIGVAVEDSGPGIPHNMADKVFEPFYTSKADGMGIGLGICQTIIEAHGGKVCVGSCCLGGASVHFDLPVDQHEDETDET